MKILIFGAGSTGRGHLAALLYEYGCRDLVFVDKNRELVESLKGSNGYEVKLLGDNQRTVAISGVQFVHREEESEIIRQLSAAELVLTAVIAENLGDVAGILARSILSRKAKGILSKQNVIACENLDNASARLKGYVYALLESGERDFADEYFGFPDAMISRVVPKPAGRQDFLIAEDYNEWVVRRRDYKGEDPGFPFMQLADNLEARLERKLWVHNGGHATVGYAGFLKGYRYIHEAVFDESIALFAGKVLEELGCVVAHKHGFSAEQMREYERDLVERGSIVEMKDDILRVVRNPVRKLGTKDRLLAPAIYACENGLANDNILKSAAGITLYYHEADTEAVWMRREIETGGIRAFLNESIGLKAYPVIAEKIIYYRERMQNEAC